MQAFRDAELVNADDVRMGELPGGACFAQEACDDAFVGGEALGQEFDGDDAVHGDLPGFEHDAHGAAAQFLQDFVSADLLARDHSILVRICRNHITLSAD